MKKIAFKKLTGLLLVAACTASVANAQTTNNQINVTTTAVPFLRISPDARSGGMGDAAIATSADPNAVFWNRAKLPFAKAQGGLSLSYTPWFKDLGINDVFLASLAGYYQLDENQTLSVGFRYFSLGNIQFTDDQGHSLSSFNPKEYGLDVGYSRKLSPKSGLSVAIRYINSDLANGTYGGQVYKAASSVAGDISFYHHGLKESGEGFNWGVAISNLGSPIKYTNDASQKDYIPANLGIGGAYTHVFDENSKITLAVDMNKLLVPSPPVISGNGTLTASDSAALNKYHTEGVTSSWFNSFSGPDQLKLIDISTGLEFWYQDQFAFRVGYFYENPDNGNRKYFTVGAGLKYNTFGLNFSYLAPSGSGITRLPLSNTVRFSLAVDFGNGSDDSKSPSLQ
ncbi:MAG TPA: type IX secretion system outer membrane channel protein PorV [Ferruginibacter sp.]|jgi:hypothetical protein|nr:type IX secretion system outer membrane channel protein PorV [Ferruginibacter sp.]